MNVVLGRGYKASVINGPVEVCVSMGDSRGMMRDVKNQDVLHPLDLE